MEEKISKQEVEHVAGLARLHLTSEQTQAFTQQLGGVLDYVEKLPEAGGEDANIRSIDTLSDLREDKVVSREASVEQLLSNVPQKQDTSIKVPAVLGGSDE